MQLKDGSCVFFFIIIIFVFSFFVVQMKASVIFSEVLQNVKHRQTVFLSHLPYNCWFGENNPLFKMQVYLALTSVNLSSGFKNERNLSNRFWTFSVDRPTFIFVVFLGLYCNI